MLAVIYGEVARISDHSPVSALQVNGTRRIHHFLWYIKAREYLWELIEVLQVRDFTTGLVLEVTQTIFQ